MHDQVDNQDVKMASWLDGEVEGKRHKWKPRPLTEAVGGGVDPSFPPLPSPKRVFPGSCVDVTTEVARDRVWLVNGHDGYDNDSGARCYCILHLPIVHHRIPP